MTDRDARLLTAEQVQELAVLHRPITRVSLETGRVGRPYCTSCWLPGPCDVTLLVDHVAALTEQLDRQAVLMASVDPDISDADAVALDVYLGIRWGPDYDAAVVRALADEIEAIRRHGREVARRRQAE